jgi:predicted  nucleic acid-binding Zn-ribbon protein
MLSGCPNCGGNKFQFQPAGRDTAEASATRSDATPADAEPSATSSDATPADTESPDPEPADPRSAEPAEPAESAEPEPPEPEGDLGAEVDPGGSEDRAQTDARSSSASVDEIDEARRTMTEAEAESSEANSPARGTPQGPPTETPSDVSPDEFDISGAVGPEDDDPVEKQPVAGSAPEHEEPETDDDADLGALREELNDQFESIKITAPGQYELNLMELYDRKEYIISLQEDGRYVIEMADDYGIDE